MLLFQRVVDGQVFREGEQRVEGMAGLRQKPPGTGLEQFDVGFPCGTGGAFEASGSALRAWLRTLSSMTYR